MNSIELGSISTQDLLLEIIKREKLMPAPTKTSRTPDHKEVLVGIGSDHVANIIISDDALDLLTANSA